jgi:hypothetical protein
MLGEDPDPFGEGLLSDDVFVRCIICRHTLQEKKKLLVPKNIRELQKAAKKF